MAAHHKDRVVVRVEVDGCARGQHMQLQLVKPLASQHVRDGCFEDAVWRVRTPGVVDRYTRLTKGRRALESLLEKYSFVDASGCPYSARPEAHAYNNARNNAHKTGERVDAEAVYQALMDAPPRRTRWFTADRAAAVRAANATAAPGACHFARTGIAQLSERSGICWYSSMFFALLFAPQMRDFLEAHVARRAQRCAHCAFLRDHLRDVLTTQACSERVRRYLYEQLGIGDPPDQAPELDGQNGCSMATLLMQKIDVPAITLLAPEMETAALPLRDAHDAPQPPPRAPRKGERAVLFVRTYRSRWRAPEVLVHRGKRYCLMSALIGSEFCGHQVGVSRSCEPEMWSFSDSDGIRLGISPLCFRVPSRARAWHEVVTRAIPYSNASQSSEFCDLSPSGRHPLKVVADHLRTSGLGALTEHVDVASTAHDLVNVDYVYLAC